MVQPRLEGVPCGIVGKKLRASSEVAYDGCMTADMIWGHVCKSGIHFITDVKKKNVQEDIDEGNVMVNPGILDLKP